MSPWYLLIFVVYLGTKQICWGQEDEGVFTSPVLKRNRTNYINFAGKTYYFGTVFTANFFRSMQYCRQQGMQLVAINSQAENDRLSKHTIEIGAIYAHFWTSGTNLGDERQWMWLSDGNNIVYSNWDTGEPSYENAEKVKENCIEVRHVQKGFAWNDITCQAEFNFICETVDACS